MTEWRIRVALFATIFALTWVLLVRVSTAPGWVLPWAFVPVMTMAWKVCDIVADLVEIGRA